MLVKERVWVLFCGKESENQQTTFWMHNFNFNSMRKHIVPFICLSLFFSFRWEGMHNFHTFEWVLPFSPFFPIDQNQKKFQCSINVFCRSWNISRCQQKSSFIRWNLWNTIQGNQKPCPNLIFNLREKYYNAMLLHLLFISKHRLKFGLNQSTTSNHSYTYAACDFFKIIIDLWEKWINCRPFVCRVFLTKWCSIKKTQIEFLWKALDTPTTDCLIAQFFFSNNFLRKLMIDRLVSADSF